MYVVVSVQMEAAKKGSKLSQYGHGGHAAAMAGRGGGLRVSFQSADALKRKHTGSNSIGPENAVLYSV